MTYTYQFLITIALVSIYCYIAYTDFTRLKIRNEAVFALAIVAGVASLLQGATYFGAAVLIGGVFFAVTFPLWLLGTIGAGDVKLIAVSGVAVGPSDVFVFSTLILIFSLLTLVVISYARHIALLPVVLSRRLTTFLSEGRIPYGLPIALAAITVIGLRTITH